MSPNMMTTILKRIYIPYCAIILPLLLLTCCPADSGLPAPREQITDVDENTLHELEDGLQNKYADGASSTNSKASHSAEDGYTEDQEKESCYEHTTVSEPFANENHNMCQLTESMRERRPTEFVVIRDGGSRCQAKKECRRQILSLRMNTTNTNCNLRENFYVGDDGTIYEGRGWTNPPFWFLRGLRNISITFMFLGEYHNDTPTREAQAGFEAALTGGVWMGKLSPDYKIASMRDILNQSEYLGNSFHGSLKNWDGWVNNTVYSSYWEYLAPKRPKFVFRRHWNASRVTRKLETLDHPVRLVVVSNGGSPCHNRSECIALMKEEQKSKLSRYGDLLENFYIGNDGSVYEGRGWNFSSHWRLGNLEKLVSVRFLGDYQNELPPEQAKYALKALVNTGIGNGKLDEEFFLLSLRLIYNDSGLLGDALASYMENWTPWKNKYNAMSSFELLHNNIAPIIYQNQWSRESKYDLYQNMTFPIKYAIVTDGGVSCFTYSQCSKIMNIEKSHHRKIYGDLLHSFYIGSDGFAYEGRGWESTPHLRLMILNDSCITVKFLGKYSDSIPNEIAMRGFKALINHGIHSGFISPEYQLYSYRHIYDEPSYLGDALSHHLQSEERWSISWETANDEEHAVIGSLPLLLREHWSSRPSVKKLEKISESIDYVVISEVGKRCFSRKECLLEMISEENRTNSLYGDVPDSFYIGMDGIVYEGLGWRIDPYSFAEGIARKLITISFIGNFEKDLPTDLAMSAFRRLLTYGESTGKLSEKYTILSARQFLDQIDFLGSRLHLQVMTWDRWAGDLNQTLMPLRNSMPRLMMIPRLDSDVAQRCNVKGSQENRPAEYIIVSSKGGRCFSHKECSDMVALNMTVRKYDGHVDNFFIAEDGFVYEGLGWDLRSIMNVSCVDCSFLTVVFLGNYNDESPSPNTTDTFNFLVKWGVGMGKISPDFRVLSIRQLCGNTTDIGDALHRHVSSGKHWSVNAGLTADCHPRQRLVTNSEWKGYNIIGYNRNHLPIESIFVSNRGDRCYSEAECMDTIRYEHLVEQEHNGGVEENFYIGDDGNVYEGRGWSRRPNHEFNFYVNSISVLFFGKFDIEPPSPIAIFAFENILIKHGLRLGKLCPNFTLRPVPDAFPIKLDRKLRKYVTTWN
ncbi:uncharacterized protein LOC124162273 isoform X2 [Ischnura elegans]|uniref:uncharacterized protein LOC124162273 isoform X2 n=1 Tax=Ischnura elegans TaxID=197161 RepID=UPI001ED89CF1|nr:uncharacterized protein LOC124162273 isoform X2 [Ischnura elegans]